MFTKALFADIEEKSIPSEYLNRIKKISEKILFSASSDPKFIEEISDTNVLLSNISTKIDKVVIDRASMLKYIGVLATAYDGIDAVYARQKEIPVCNLGGYSTEAVAEFVFATLFEAIRELERAKQQARAGDYSFTSFMGIELKNKVLGVIGAGKIGSRVAEVGLGIGMKVLYASLHEKPELEKRGANKVSIDKLMKLSDVISLNLIQDDQTKGIITKEKIGLMKRGAIFVNTAGAKPIDWDAMKQAVKNGLITLIFHFAHGLDLAVIKEFQQYKNCQFYPGIAFRTAEANIARWETFTSNIEQFVMGKPQNVVN